jgi:hypothetical protein
VVLRCRGDHGLAVPKQPKECIRVPTQGTYDEAVQRLRGVLAQVSLGRPDIKQIIDSRDGVLAQYRIAFQAETVGRLSEETFRSFLYFENNHHWTGLFRQVNALCADMAVLRGALALLLDETRPLPQRFNWAIKRVRGLGKGIATAILLVSDPEKYGVWNNTSEAALRSLDLWTSSIPARTTGEQYEEINALLNNLANDLGIDLWTLDATLWGVLPQSEQPVIPERD